MSAVIIYPRSQVELMRAVWQKNYCRAFKTNYLILWVLTGNGYKTYQENVIKHIDNTAVISWMSIKNKCERLRKISWKMCVWVCFLNIVVHDSEYKSNSRILKIPTAAIYETFFDQHKAEEMWPQLTNQWFSVLQSQNWGYTYYIFPLMELKTAHQWGGEVGRIGLGSQPQSQISTACRLEDHRRLQLPIVRTICWNRWLDWAGLLGCNPKLTRPA